MFVFGKGWVYENETDGDNPGSGAPAGDGADVGGVQDAGGAGDGADGGEGSPQGGKKEETQDMKSAIDVALGYQKPQDDVEAKGEKKAPAEPGKDTETHYASGKPKKNDKGEELDEAGKVKTAKPKSAAELDLKADELKTLGPRAQQRFREVIGTLKAHEGTISTLSAQNKSLQEARDAIIGVLQETNTTQDELAGYLEFNQKLKSGDPRQLESALQIIEQQRVALYRALGREPQGGDVNLLAEFPDLVKQVEDEEITRAAALEIANGRRERAAREASERQARQQQSQQAQSAEARKQAADKALSEIEKWTAEVSKSDLDYKAKEDRLLAQLDEVLKEYPPNLWLTTLKRLYSGIVIQKAPGDGGSKPLRPSGAKPGAKTPGSMLEAINSGLGYGSG